MVKPSLFDPREAKKALAKSGGLSLSSEVVAKIDAAVSSLQSTGAVAKSSTHLSGSVDPLVQDFRKFLFLVWQHLDLPAPTVLQYDIARWLQIGPDRAVIMGFRGVAKSWITAAFALWTLYCDPQKKVLVVSGSAVRSVAFTNFCLSLIRTMPLLQHLQPRADQRQSSTAFDVDGALPDQTPSFSARGVTGQLVGLRSDLIIPDDVETNTNSMTPDMRTKLKASVKEFDAILKPGGKVKYLGTPQTSASIYVELQKRGYTIRVWTARYPNAKQREAYGSKLAPMIRKAVDANQELEGHSTEPSRFTDDDLAQRELSWGSTGFALQYMLDTSLSDISRYPLKLRNLIVMPLDKDRGPDVLTWGPDEKTRIKHLPVIGQDGDDYYGPSTISTTTTPWVDTIMEIDPSGRGADETAYAVESLLHARVFLREVGGYLDGYSPATLNALAEKCVFYRVRKARIESNFGDGMFSALFKPYLLLAWERHNTGKPEGERGGTTIEEVQAKRVQKELRILSTLEAVMGSNRLVVCSTAIEKDFKSIEGLDTDLKERYSFAYQMTNLTREKDSLTHDDRLEVVAGGCNEWIEILGLSPEKLAGQAEEDRFDEAVRKLMGEEDGLQGIQRAGGKGSTGARHGVGAGRR